MEKLPKDLIMSIALEYDMPTLLSTCLTSKRMKEIICDNETFWMNKVRKDYPETFNNLAKKENLGKFSWKSLYNRRYNVEKGITKFILTDSESAYGLIGAYRWNNASGMSFNSMQGWKLRKDKNLSKVVYLHPSTYYTLSGPKPKQGENHSVNLIKVEFSPNPIIIVIPWDESVLGEDVHYRRGDGKVSWYDDLYMHNFEFDGSHFFFKTYSLIF